MPIDRASHPGHSARYVKEREIDILIIGAYSHSPLRSLLFGS